MYTHPEGSPDDGLHAGVYAFMAANLDPSNGSANIRFTGVRM